MEGDGKDNTKSFSGIPEAIFVVSKNKNSILNISRIFFRLFASAVKRYHIFIYLSD